MRVISPVSLPTYLSVVYRNNMSAVPASIHLKTNVDRIYLLLLKTVLSFPSLLSKTMSIFQDFFKTFLQFSQIQDYFQDLNEFINFKTFSSLEENVRTMVYLDCFKNYFYLDLGGYLNATYTIIQWLDRNTGLC